jgi:L-fucose isomerase-like protein
MKSEKQTFGVIIATRNIFNARLAVEARAKVLEKLAAMGFNSLILPAEDTPTGNIEGYADAVKCAAFFRQHQDAIEGIIVVLPNFGDELGVVNSIKLSGLNVPVLVQAVDDDNDKVDVKSRRDAFCGKLSVCNNFYQYGIKFTDTIYHTYSLDSEEFTKDIQKFACHLPRGKRPERSARRSNRYPPHWLPNHAFQRKTAPEIRHHSGSGGYVGDNSRCRKNKRYRP